jgi:osmotically inducible lipoprotein OsmB
MASFIQEFQMKLKRLTTGIATASMCVGLLAACGTNPSKQEIGTAGGAVVGGVAGAVLTGGSTLGTVGGAAAGGLIGNQVGKGMDNK